MSGYGKLTFTRTRVADPQWTLPRINRIMGHPIGVFIVLGKHSYGVCRPISGADRRAKQERKMR